MNNKLIPVKLPNKHGHLVTRWVLPGSPAASASASKIGAPVLGAPRPAAFEGFQSEQVAVSEDPRVQSGQMFDRVITGGRLFCRSREDVRPADFSQVRVQLNRPIREGEADRIASIIGYAFKASMRSSWDYVEVAAQDSPYSVILNADTSSNNRSSIEKAALEFDDSAREMLVSGSPVRATDRAGAGTKGTRLLEGMGEDGLEFELYYDRVSGDFAQKTADERGTLDVEVLDGVLSHDVKPLAGGML